LLNLFVSLLSVSMGASTTIIWQTDAPGSDDYDKLWVRLRPDGSMEGIYKFFGAWRRPHPVPPSSLSRLVFTGSTDDLVTYDGGAAGAVGDYSGPMWEEDTDFQFRFPIGAGTNPTAYAPNPATIIGVAGTGGAEQMVIDAAILPAHQHYVVSPGAGSSALSSVNYVPSYGGTTGPSSSTEYWFINGADAPATEGLSSVYPPGGTPGDAPTSNLVIMPPYRGVIFAKRTARLDYIPS
jgi:hypothetical protein